jgi:TIR domain
LADRPEHQDASGPIATRAATSFRIFLNYRREDASGHAGRLYDFLLHGSAGAGFRKEQIFMDIEEIDPGVHFPDVIGEAVGSCDVFIAVMGRRWLDATDAAGRRRLDKGNDFVRVEIEAALARDIPVVPVLVQGAEMPSLEELPESLQAFGHRNAVELSDARWSYDVGRLSDWLKTIEEEKQRREQAERERSEELERKRADQERLERERREREAAERERLELAAAQRDAAEREAAEQERARQERQAAKREQRKTQAGLAAQLAAAAERAQRELQEREAAERERQEAERAERERAAKVALTRPGTRLRGDRAPEDQEATAAQAAGHADESKAAPRPEAIQPTPPTAEPIRIRLSRLKRRYWILIAALLAGVGALVVVFAVLRSGGSGGEGPYPNAAEQDLLSHIPAEIASTCTRMDAESSGAQAHVSCDAPSVGTAVEYQTPEDTYFGSCLNEPKAWQHGQVCEDVFGGDPSVYWIDDRFGISGKAEFADVTPAKLREEWECCLQLEP